MNILIKAGIALALLMQTTLAYAVENAGQTYDLGIESMRSHSYSVGIFVFLLISILVFLFILSAFWRNSKGASIKTGEKVLLGMIVVGVFVAIAFAAAQLLDGFLF